MDDLKSRIVTVKAENFDELALEIFQLQAKKNAVYGSFLKNLGVNPRNIHQIAQIPFMPIGFFKNHEILTGNQTIQAVFESSGTTGQSTSRHLVSDLAFYRTVAQTIFEQKYGALSNFHVLALLPSYLERNNSSLVYMVQDFIEKSGSEQSGFFLTNAQELVQTLRHLCQNPDGRKILLMGVTFGLLDLAEAGFDLGFLRQAQNLIVMETGGMKGRRREMLREEVHQVLTRAFGVAVVHSEYGMTELLSQGYSGGSGVFDTPPTMRVLLRDINDPFCVYPPHYERTGGINVVDLANIDTCSFVETQDLGQYVFEGQDPQQFRVIGRFDNSDVRGCNLMIL